MKSLDDATYARMRNCVRIATPLASALFSLAFCAAAPAQPADKPAETKPDIPTDAKPEAESYQTLYIHNLTEQHEANDLVTDLRNMLPRAKVYYVSAENAISLRGSQEDFVLAQKILADIDRSRKAYRVTYTIAEIEGGKRVGEQHYALIVSSTGRTDLKLGNRVPIVTGSETSNSGQNTQVQYLDVGLNIEASLEGDRLHTKVEQSSMADEKSGLGAQDPIVRQTTLEGTSTLLEGKRLVLGSLDVPGSTRHQEIEVAAETIQ
jgi:type II secretory pathway component GspD/PulD (secretin)